MRNIGVEVVLIETYWNVNFFPQSLAKDSGRSLNRNILECKFQRRVGKGSSQSQVLIETYWNVNTYFEGKKAENKWVLIETYWNVNAVDTYIRELIV